MVAKISFFITFCQGVVTQSERQYVSLDSYICGCLCCLNTHMCHKSKGSNEINWPSCFEHYILALLYAVKYIVNT